MNPITHHEGMQEWLKNLEDKATTEDEKKRLASMQQQFVGNNNWVQNFYAYSNMRSVMPMYRQPIYRPVYQPVMYQQQIPQPTSIVYTNQQPSMLQVTAQNSMVQVVPQQSVIQPQPVQTMGSVYAPITYQRPPQAPMPIQPIPQQTYVQPAMQVQPQPAYAQYPAYNQGYANVPMYSAPYGGYGGYSQAGYRPVNPGPSYGGNYSVQPKY